MEPFAHRRHPPDAVSPQDMMHLHSIMDVLQTQMDTISWVTKVGICPVLAPGMPTTLTSGRGLHIASHNVSQLIQGGTTVDLDGDPTSFWFGVREQESERQSKKKEKGSDSECVPSCLDSGCC